MTERADADEDWFVLERLKAENARLREECDIWKAETEKVNLAASAHTQRLLAAKEQAEARATAAEAKAALADEYRRSRANLVLIGLRLSNSEKEWCDHYDALATASQEPSATPEFGYQGLFMGKDAAQEGEQA